MLTPALLLAAVFAAPAASFTPQSLWELWPDVRFVTTVAPCLRPAELHQELQRLAAKHPDSLQLEEIGRSFQNRPIHMLTLGRGPSKILLWSQMHGDEPAATPALLDLAGFLLDRADQPEARAILDSLTLLIIPMLNPDGAESYSRRNAQAIDINRDALNLATPEGQILKAIRDQHQPILGFNLHDQNRRTAVGDTGKLATNAVLAVAGDPEGTVTPGRLRAKRACAAIVEALAPFMPGGMARYDEDWSPRAFGDNLTAWGTPVVLIESGGLPPGRDFSELTRLNFVALLSTLHALVRNDLADFDPEVYEELERNASDQWSDVAIRGGEVLQPASARPYRADLSFNLLQGDRRAAGCADDETALSRIVEIGDSRFIAAGRDVDASHLLVAPPLAIAVEGYSARKWLDGEVLEELAKMGVGTVYWQVRERRQAAAVLLASQWATSPGRAQVRVGVAKPGLPRLDHPPVAGSRNLGDILFALDGEIATRTPEHSRSVVQALWPAAAAARGSSVSPTALRPGAPASFLLISTVEPSGSTNNGELDPATATLQAVWIDGVEVLALPLTPDS